METYTSDSETSELPTRPWHTSKSKITWFSLKSKETSTSVQVICKLYVFTQHCATIWFLAHHWLGWEIATPTPATWRQIYNRLQMTRWVKSCVSRVIVRAKFCNSFNCVLDLVVSSNVSPSLAYISITEWHNFIIEITILSFLKYNIQYLSKLNVKHHQFPVCRSRIIYFCFPWDMTTLRPVT